MRPARIRDPSIAVADRTPRAVRESAANDDRRLRLLHRLRPSPHLREVDDLAVIFGLGFGPDLRHRLDLLAHFLEARFEDGAVIFNFVLVPAAADAKQKPPAGNLVDRSDELCRLDRVALDDEAHPGPNLQGLCRHRRCRQGHERVHHVVILLAELAASRRRRFAGAGDVRVLGRPYRLEAALFERPAELGRRHRVIGEKHRRAKIHLFLHRSDRPSLRSIDESAPESRGIRAPATSGLQPQFEPIIT